MLIIKKSVNAQNLASLNATNIMDDSICYYLFHVDQAHDLHFRITSNSEAALGTTTFAVYQIPGYIPPLFSML